MGGGCSPSKKEGPMPSLVNPRKGTITGGRKGEFRKKEGKRVYVTKKKGKALTQGSGPEEKKVNPQRGGAGVGTCLNLDPGQSVAERKKASF